MLASILIIVFSFVLFAYWFRYSCILILSSRGEQGARVGERFHFAEVQRRLEGKAELEAGGEMDPLHLALERDYQLFSYLKAHAASLDLERFECRLLVLDYKLMRSWYRFTRSIAPRQARNALKEMADVLGVLAGRIEEHAGVHSEV